MRQLVVSARECARLTAEPDLARKAMEIAPTEPDGVERAMNERYDVVVPRWLGAGLLPLPPHA